MPHWNCSIAIENNPSEYDQEIPQSLTADQFMAPLGRATER